MATILYIMANPKEEEFSYGLSIGRTFLNFYQLNSPEDVIVELDLYKVYIPLIDSDVLSAWQALYEGKSFADLTEEQQQKVVRIDELTDQFMRADKYVFVTPMWNLGLPPVMKAYIDTVVIARKTFEYSSNGPRGLLKDKIGIHIHTRGGIYDYKHEFANNYIKAIMGFIGVDMQKAIIVEGMSSSLNDARQIKENAMVEARMAAKVFALT